MSNQYTEEDVAKHIYNGIFNNLPHQIIIFGISNYPNKYALNKFFKFLDLYFDEPENREKLKNTNDLDALVTEKMKQWIKIMDFKIDN